MIERTGFGRNKAHEEPGALSRIRRRLAQAATGKGGVVYVDGPAGPANAQLVTGTVDGARSADMCILHAQGRALERDFPFGVAIQLFEETWFLAGPNERATLLDGPARPAGELLSGALSGGLELGAGRGYAIIHGLFWLARALASGGVCDIPARPLALIVDEVDSADEPSLRFLAYLAPRIGPFPIALVVTAHADQASADRPALRALRAASEHLVPDGPDPSAPAEEPRRAAADMALRKSLADGHRESVLDLAQLAWGDGALLESDGAADAWPAVAGALLFVDELEFALAVGQAAAGSGTTAGPPGAALSQGWSLYHQGRITAALAAAETVRAKHRSDPVARGLIAACRLAQGRLGEAEAALPRISDGDGIQDFDVPALLDVRAQLRLEQLRPADAVADALEAGRLSRGSWGVMGPGVVAWRSTAALAQLALGNSERARGLAGEELDLARERGLTRVVIRDLRVLAFAAKGARVLDLLAEAVKIGRAAPPRLEYMNALVDLGAATRRANQRTAARHPLRVGLDLAERGGAGALVRRARDELGATGARSRRVMLTGVQALTPSERRVADLAASGLTTRQIAQVLFVTPKTVEFHLRHVYRKLDIPSSRGDLARAISAAASG